MKQTDAEVDSLA